MGFKCGIVGLPNVGKSTLFNALTQTAAAEAANYPFCTIEPNVGEVGVPDRRLDKLAAIGKSGQIIPTRLTFVDIAGLVRGASKGEGLGNQFLGHIREVDAVAYVLRCFDDGNVTHVEGRIDPLADAEVVETELMLADMDSLEKRRSNIEKKAKTGDKESKLQVALMDKALVLLREGKPARLAELTPEEHQQFPGDTEAQVGQGPITFHSEEHLMSTDRGVAMLRLLLQKQVDVVARGGDPVGVAFTETDAYVKFDAGQFLES